MTGSNYTWNFTLEPQKKAYLYPNPAVSEATLVLQAEKSEQITVELRDIKGQLIKKISEATKVKEGEHKYNFTLSDVPNGVYIIKVNGNKTNTTVKLVVAK